MHRRSFLLLLTALSLPLLSGLRPSVAVADDGYRVSDAVTHENVAIYFVHGPSRGGPVPLTLEEGLSAKTVRVYETSNVNELAIENLGDQEVFVQSGDIVKGGQQDRALTVSLLLPPHSGRLPIAAFCVEQGRWSKRGSEDVLQFSSAAASVPSREAKIVLRSAPPVLAAAPIATAKIVPRSAPPDQAAAPFEPAAPAPNTGARLDAARDYAAVAERQREVWQEVARVQNQLSSHIRGVVNSPLSQTSLQLALESEKLKQAQEGYIKALKTAGEQEKDIVGYVFTVNGKPNSAEIYPSNTLFRKMWPKLLSANATEAIAAKDGLTEPAPSLASVNAFLKEAEAGKASKRALPHSVELETRDADRALYAETRRQDGTWVYRNYLAK
jgi:hypothetical protein